MIACYADDGQIFNVYHDPIPDGMKAHLNDARIRWAEYGGEGSPQALIEGFYVLDGKVAARPPLTAVISQDQDRLVISGIPANSVCTVITDAGTDHSETHALEANAGVLSFPSADMAGCRLIIDAPFPIMRFTHDF